MPEFSVVRPPLFQPFGYRGRAFLRVFMSVCVHILGWKLLEYPAQDMWEARRKPRGLTMVIVQVQRSVDCLCSFHLSEASYAGWCVLSWDF